jgi:hypothetical protein
LFDRKNSNRRAKLLTKSGQKAESLSTSDSRRPLILQSTREAKIAVETMQHLPMLTWKTRCLITTSATQKAVAKTLMKMAARVTRPVRYLKFYFKKELLVFRYAKEDQTAVSV